MSTDVATPMTETAAAPAPAEAVAVPETEAQTGPQKRAELRQRARGRPVAAQVNTPHPSDAQPRSENGRFASPEPSVTTEPTAPTEPQSDTATAAQAPTDGRIELPETDPLRLRGKRYVDELTSAEFRSLINRSQSLPEPVLRAMVGRFDAETHAVHAAAEQAAQREREIQRRAAQAEAQASAWREAAEAFFGSPETAQYYAELKAVNPEVAEAFKRGKLAELQEGIARKQQEADEAFEQTLTAERGRAFARDAWQTAIGRYPQWYTATPEFQQAFQRALYTYGANLEAGFVQQESVTEFIAGHMDPAFYANPHVQSYLGQTLSQRREQEAAHITARAQQEAAEAQRRQLEEAARRAQSNPGGRMNPAMQTGQGLPVQVGPRSAPEARQRLRDRKMGRA